MTYKFDPRRILADIEKDEQIKHKNQYSQNAPDKHDAYEIEFVSRPKLKKYYGFGSLDFHATFGFKSSLIDGTPVALLTKVRDPLNHDILTDHVWVKLNESVAKFLDHLKQDSPIRVRAKVILYHGEKVGLRIDYINLVKNQRTYTLASKILSPHEKRKSE